MAGDGIGVQEKCDRYAYWFTTSATRQQPETIFWVLFFLGIVCLVTSGVFWANSDGLTKAFKEIELDARRGFTQHDPDELLKRLVRSRWKTVKVTSACAAISIILTCIEAIALLALEHCHGEDLVQLYWSFWSLIQVGGCIALVGLAVYHIYTFRQQSHPPWMIALGTPVLVIAGLGHLLFLSIVSLLRKCTGRRDSLPDEEAVIRSYAERKPPWGNTCGPYQEGLGVDEQTRTGCSGVDNGPFYQVQAQIVEFDPDNSVATLKWPVTGAVRERLSQPLKTSSRESQTDG